MQSFESLTTRSSLSSPQGSDLKTYAGILVHWAWLWVLMALVGGITAYGVSTMATPIYQTSTILLINQAHTPSSTSYQDVLLSERVARTYSELMPRASTQQQVMARTGIDAQTYEETITNIEVTPVRDTQLVRVTVEGTSPELVTSVANTLPNVFIGEIGELQSERFAESKENLQTQLAMLDEQINSTQALIDAQEATEVQGAAQSSEQGSDQSRDAQNDAARQEVELARLRNMLSQYQTSYANVLQSFETLRLTEVQSVDSIAIAETAQVPELPIRPRPLVNTLLAALASILAAFGIIFLVEYLDDSIKSPVELQRLLPIPVLGAIARFRVDGSATMTPSESLITITEPRHPIAESFRGVRTNVQFSNVDSEVRTLMVTSANPSDGKTTTATNLATVFAQSGKSVILVDADLRKPQVHRFFELSKSPGLTDLLFSEEPFSPASLAEPFHDTPLSHLSLRVLSSGKQPPNPSELLGSQRMQQLIEQLKAEADIVIFDVSPLRAVTDAQVLGSQLDGTVLVVKSGADRGSVVQAFDALKTVNARVLGAVLNQLTRSARTYNYYYDYRYQNYYGAGGSDSGDDGSDSGSGGLHSERAERRSAVVGQSQPATLSVERTYSQV